MSACGGGGGTACGGGTALATARGTGTGAGCPRDGSGPSGDMHTLLLCGRGGGCSGVRSTVRHGSDIRLLSVAAGRAALWGPTG